MVSIFSAKMATDDVVVRRNRPGTKASDFYNWPDQDFNDMDTTLAGKLCSSQIL